MTSDFKKGLRVGISIMHLSLVIAGLVMSLKRRRSQDRVASILADHKERLRGIVEEGEKEIALARTRSQEGSKFISDILNAAARKPSFEEVQGDEKSARRIREAMERVDEDFQLPDSYKESIPPHSSEEEIHELLASMGVDPDRVKIVLLS